MPHARGSLHTCTQSSQGTALHTAKQHTRRRTNQFHVGLSSTWQAVPGTCCRNPLQPRQPRHCRPASTAGHGKVSTHTRGRVGSWEPSETNLILALVARSRRIEPFESLLPVALRCRIGRSRSGQHHEHHHESRHPRQAFLRITDGVCDGRGRRAVDSAIVAGHRACEWRGVARAAVGCNSRECVPQDLVNSSPHPDSPSDSSSDSDSPWPYGQILSSLSL